MNNIQIFNNSEFGKIRTAIIDGDIWFVGRDVASALGYAKPQNALRDNVEEGDALTQGIPDANNHTQQMIVINESGMYDLVMASKLPSAKKFRRWITHDVIPSIRKTGTYSIPQTPDEKIQLIAQGYVEMRKDIDAVKEEVSDAKNDISDVKSEIQTLKNDLPIFLNEAQSIVDAVRKKGIEMLGGKDTKAYTNGSIRSKVYRSIYSEIYRNFEISSYKNLKRRQLSAALEVVKSYKLPIVMKDKIVSVNG